MLTLNTIGFSLTVTNVNLKEKPRTPKKIKYHASQLQHTSKHTALDGWAIIWGKRFMTYVETNEPTDKLVLGEGWKENRKAKEQK